VVLLKKVEYTSMGLRGYYLIPISFVNLTRIQPSQEKTDSEIEKKKALLMTASTRRLVRRDLNLPDCMSVKL